MKADPVVISVGQAGDIWRILATNYGRTEPAGERIFRAPPHPEIKYVHTTRESAQADADKLTRYLNECTAKSRPSKRALRAFGA